jgi:xylulokinase
MEYVIGCDIGSQSLKAILISSEGKTCGEASASYAINYPQPAWAEQSPASWVDALTQAIRTLLAHSYINPGQIVSIGLDAQVDGVVAVGRQGKPLYPAIIWMDRRAVDSMRCCRAPDPSDQVFKITGLNLDPSRGAKD